MLAHLLDEFYRGFLQYWHPINNSTKPYINPPISHLHQALDISIELNTREKEINKSNLFEIITTIISQFSL